MGLFERLMVKESQTATLPLLSDVSPFVDSFAVLVQERLGKAVSSFHNPAVHLSATKPPGACRLLSRVVSRTPYVPPTFTFASQCVSFTVTSTFHCVSFPSMFTSLCMPLTCTSWYVPTTSCSRLNACHSLSHVHHLFTCLPFSPFSSQCVPYTVTCTPRCVPTTSMPMSTFVPLAVTCTPPLYVPPAFTVLLSIRATHCHASVRASLVSPDSLSRVHLGACLPLPMAVASGGGQLPPQSKNHHWRIIETKIRIWTFWEFRYGVVWFPLKNHYLD